MHSDAYLSYSGRRTYLLCPRKYHFNYTLKDKVPRDPRTALLGLIIGKVFEWFYGRRAWGTADPIFTTMSYIDDATRIIFQQEQFDAVIDPAFCSLLRQDLLTYVPAGIETIRNSGFLTPCSRAEVNLQLDYTSLKHEMTLRIGGKADFIHGTGPSDVWILDGKASKHREKYVEADQLIWYAVQHYIKYHVAPVRLGFIFWCFPENPVKWVAYDNVAMRDSLDKTFETAKKIQLKQFDATPSGECHRCDFIKKCDDGQRHLAKRKMETGGRIESSIFDLEDVNS